MLILEIRDNSLRIIQAINKVKNFSIKSSKMFTFEDSWKIFISDPDNAAAVTETVKSFSKDNKALLLLNTSTVIYREMVVPKASPRYLATMIRHELSHALNLSSDFLIDYTILDDTIKNDKKMNKIMVTAVSATSLNEIIEFFDKTGIQIVKIDVSLNSVQKYVEITKIADKSKNVLFAEIGTASIRQYLFEKGKYSVYRTTRLATLAQQDEQLSLEAATETIEKMLQFSASLGQNSGIDQIVLFGAYSKIEHLKLYMNDKLGTETVVIGKPKMLIVSKNKPFDHDEAYALGVLFSQRFKRKKDINLMTAYNAYYSRSSSTFNFDALFNSLAFGLAYVALFAVILSTIQTSIVNSDIQKINAYLNRADVIETLDKIASMKTNIASLSELKTELESIQRVLDSIPRFNSMKIIDLLSVKPEGVVLTQLNFTENTITLSIIANDPSLIHDYVLLLSELSPFSDVTYTSYTYEEKERIYTSEITLTLGGEITQ
jgi:type IV pilus assembly protein PilM